jgi:hypothetical protein
MRHLISKYSPTEYQNSFYLNGFLHFSDFRYDFCRLIKLISKAGRSFIADSFPALDGKRSFRTEALVLLPIPVHEQHRGSILRSTP